MNKLLLTLLLLFISIPAWANSGWYSTLQGAASDVEQSTPPNGVGLYYNSTDHMWEFSYGFAPSGGTTGQVLTKNSNSNYDYSWANGGGGNPGGSNTQVQYNSSGTFAGSNTLTFDGTNLYIGSVTIGSGSISVSQSGAFDGTLNLYNNYAYPQHITDYNGVSQPSAYSLLEFDGTGVAWTQISSAWLSDGKTGSGYIVFSNTPTIATPVISGSETFNGSTSGSTTVSAHAVARGSVDLQTVQYIIANNLGEGV